MVAGSNPVAPTANGMIDIISVIPFVVYTHAPGHRLTANPKRIVATLLFNNVSMNPRTLTALTEDIKKRRNLGGLFFSGGAYGTRTRDPMRDRHVF